MSALLFIVLILAFTGHSSGNWCVCRDGLSEAVLQKALDYACGAGADCNPIHQNGVCYNPNTVRAHCSYAVNSYYQKKGQSGATCDFAGSAAISSSDPSFTGCGYPSSLSAAGSSITPVTTTPSTNTPKTSSPYTSTPSTTGIYGAGLGPSGMDSNISHGVSMIKSNMLYFFVFLSGLAYYLWS